LILSYQTFSSENDDYSGIWLSDDGGETFELALRFKPESYPNNDFISFNVDIDSLAYEQSLNLTSTFVVRFQQRGNADFNTSNDEDGLFIDEVKVSGELLSPQAPIITSFTPMSGYPGEEVTIVGENFSPAPIVRFNQLLSPSISYINSGELKAIVPQLASTGKIGVETEFGSALSEEEFTVLGSGVIFFEDWETGTIRPMWSTNSSIPEGLITVGEVIGSSVAASGFYGIALGKTTDAGGFNINQLDLHIPLGDYQGKNVLLSYDIKGFYEDTHPEDGVYISNDGGASFEKVYDFDYSSWSNLLYGKLPPLELSRITELLGLPFTDDYVIRFQQADFGDFNTSNDEDGIFLDNILIEERSVVYAQLPFTEGFETSSLNNAWTWAMPTATSPDSWIRPGGLLEITGWEVATQSGNYGLRMGRRTDGNTTVNALDLGLHLQGYSDVVLNFGLSDFYDESQAEEGIYFSNDGGETFTSQPVFLFNTASQPNEVYQNFTLNLDSLALANNLPYTDEFVIRFQQLDNADFNFSNDEDGIFLDNISVTGNITNGQPQITYLSPSIGPIGIEVDIVGINLQGTNGVTFNGVSAIDYEEESNQKIKAIVPDGATTGKVIITTPIGEAVSPYDFQVVEGNDLGIKTILAPQSGCELGEEEVVIELQNYGALAINEQIELSYSVEGQPPVTENTSIVLAPGATLTYTFAETANLSLLQEFTLTVTLAYAGDGNAENDMLVANIENYDNPTASISGGGFICVGDNVQLSAEGGAAYLWNTGATTSILNVSPSTTTTYTVTVTDENACFDIANTTVEVGSPEVPEILLPQGNVLCPGGVLVLQSSIAQNVIWSTDEFGSQIEVTSPGEYFVTYVDPNTDCAVVSEAVNIVQAPVLSISGEVSPICEGASVSLYVTGAATLLWSTGAATSTITVTPSVASSYSVTATDANGCTFTDEVFIDVIPDEPVGAVSNLLPADGTFNIPPTTPLSWSPAANATLYDLYLWEEGTPEPTQPYYNDIAQISTTVFGLSVGATYNWYVLPKNECQEGTPSPTQSFTVAERPDLIVENINVPSSANSGTEIEVRWDVRNIGNQSTEDDNWLDFAFLSTDQSLSANDQFLGSLTRPIALNAGQAYEAVLSYQLPPCIDGDYYVIVLADGYNTLAEMLENNNSEVSTVAVPIALSPRADLKVTSILPPGVAGILQEGESYEISWTVENDGNDTTRANGWYDRVFINTEPFDNPQTRIPVQPNSWVYQDRILFPDSTYRDTLSFTLPNGLEDTVYFYVLTDFSDQEEECLFEDNNRDRTDALWINPDPKPDFRLKAIQIPPQASNREAVELYWELLNVGAAYNGTLQARVYLSDQPAFTGSGFFTSFNINDNFINGPVISGEQTITIPDYITGDHYLTVVINPANQIDEGSFFDEENRKTAPIHILTPNLVADSIVPASSTVVAGENLEVSWYLHNSGPGSLVNRTVTDYINLPGVSTASPSTLTLAPGQSTTRNGNFTIPLMTSPGNYTLQLQTNGNLGVYEAGQTQDNTVQSVSTVTVVAPERPDLIGDFIQPDEDNYFIGDDLEITYSVSNIGEVATAGNWKAGVYMSTSPIFNPFSNLAFGPRNIAQAIAVGGAFSESFTVSIPAYVNPGTYYLHLVADVTDAVFELSEENNTITSIPFTIQALPPASIVDLSLTNVVASDNITAGTPVQLSWRTTNIGNTATIAGQWIDRLYVAESPTFEVNQAIEVTSWQRSGGLAPEQFYTKLESFVLPNDLPEGEVYLFLVTDADETTLDDDRANNVVPIVAGEDDEPVVVDIPPKPDLAVTIENAPQAAVAGQPIEVIFTVTNNGTGATANAWLDRVLLSNNEQASASDITIGQSTNVQSLGPGESYQDTISGFIPISASGNFFLLVNTDASHLVTENNESNNTESAYINIVSPPPGDIVVQQVSTIPEAMSNDTITVDWVLKNVGENPIAGYMEQVLYISQDTSWSADDVELARWQGNANIGQEQEAAFTQELCLTDVQDGDYHFIIRADVLNNIIEVDDTNNDGYNANPININVPDLYVDIVENTTLPLEKPVYYRFVVDEELAGETVSISLTSNEQNAVNEMYVRYEAVPNRTVFDLVYDVPFEENQRIIISDLVVGTYYVMAYSVLGSQNQDVELLAEIVPFEITSIDTDVGGNTGLVTTELRGTRFAQGMQIRLENGGDPISAQQVNVVSELRAFVTFDLLGQPLDTFDVVAISSDETDESVLIDGFVIAEGIMPTGGLSYSCDMDGAAPLFFTIGDDIDAGNPLELEKIHPATARPNQLITITFRYENTGNIDVELPQLLISSLGGAPLSIDPEIFEEDILEIGMEFQEEDGPPNILRPGGEAVFTVYTRAIAELRFRLF
jgi:subtilase family serine protease